MSNTYGYKKYLRLIDKYSTKYPFIQKIDKTELARFLFDIIKRDGQNKYTGPEQGISRKP
jgi:hypothetical protein